MDGIFLLSNAKCLGLISEIEEYIFNYSARHLKLNEDDKTDCIERATDAMLADPEYGVKSYSEVAKYWSEKFSNKEFSISWRTLFNRTAAKDPNRATKTIKKKFTGRRTKNVQKRIQERSIQL